MTTKTVVTYVRVSSEVQADDDKVSIPEQLSDIETLITRNGWIVAEAFSDAERYVKTKSPNKGKRVQPSGEYDDRPGFMAMLDLVKRGGIDAIVCWRDDRLMRHTRVYSAVEDALDEADKIRQGRPPVEVYDATGNKLDRFVLGIKAQVGKEENKRRVERIKLGRIGTLKRGLWPGPYHRFGYATEKADRGNRIVLGKESEIQTVKDIVDWYDAGMETVEIRRRLIAEDREQRGQFNGGKPHRWGVGQILGILRCEDYTGKATWDFGDGTPPMTIEIPQIISPEQFKRVQKRRRENLRVSPRKTKGVFLLQNIAVCGSCGGKLGAAAKNRFYYRRQADGTVKRYERKNDPGYRYCCFTAVAYPEEPHTKPTAFDGATLDARFWAYVVDNMITHPELITEQVQHRQAELQEQGDDLDGEIAKKRKQLKVIEQDKITYTRQLAREKLTESAYDTLMAEADENEADLREQLDHLLTLRDDQKKTQGAITYAERLLANYEERLPEINQTLEELASLPEDKRKWVMSERQKIIRGLCDKVIVYANGEITIEGLIEVKQITNVTQKKDI